LAIACAIWRITMRENSKNALFLLKIMRLFFEASG